MPEELSQEEQSFSGADKYAALKSKSMIDQEKPKNQDISKEEVDAQVEILNRLFAGKSEQEIVWIKTHSIQDNELNRRALEERDNNVVDMDDYRHESGEEAA